jgi:hypothetical protein
LPPRMLLVKIWGCKVWDLFINSGTYIDEHNFAVFFFFPRILWKWLYAFWVCGKQRT